jgi:hypothetical protein
LLAPWVAIGYFSPHLLWLLLTVYVMCVMVNAAGGGDVCGWLHGEAVGLESSSSAEGLSMSMCAQGELLYLLTGVVLFDPARESGLLSSEVERDGIVAVLALWRLTMSRVSSMVFFTNFASSAAGL